MSTFVTRELFGGAITASTVADLVDASDLRQVPDTQEVFMYSDSTISIVVEILERVEPSDDYEAARFHFASLAHDNDAAKSDVHESSIIPHDRVGDLTPPAIVLRGRQEVTKFNRRITDTVDILMALYRVQDHNIDIVVTFNLPVETADAQGAADPAQRAEATSHFDVFARSLRINDFNLFAS
ncbi:Mog1p/PsbP-like protein [Pluteus cervinus]|uniref:Mog1p/PsbP-like protein n=1 Tax=Pluteus cervinus TaxID=181527 RepID=A0ACD3B2K9_9AGAR|nr:Mog1p/PsbP-like protein [Pluteus cervinus]